MPNRLETIETTDSEKNKWRRLKKQQKIVLAAFREDKDFFVRYERMYWCGKHLLFGRLNSERKLVSANFCKDTLCPVCNKRKSVKLFHEVKGFCSFLEGDGYQFLHVMVSVRNGFDLEERVEHLYKSFRKLYRRKWWKERFQGYFSHLEITYSEKFGWHPHLHIIVATNTVQVPMAQDEFFKLRDGLSNMWAEITGDSFITHVDGVKNLYEVCKYVTDFSKMSCGKDGLREMARVLSNRRQFNKGGVFRGVDLESVEESDLVDLEVDEDDLNEFESFELWSWNDAKGEYEVREVKLSEVAELGIFNLKGGFGRESTG